MKTSLIIIPFVFIYSFLNAQKNNIKANIFSPLVKTGSFFYERKLNDKHALQFGFYLTYLTINNSINLTSNNDNNISLGTTIDYKIYPLKNAMNGFYMSPFLRYIYNIHEYNAYIADIPIYDSTGNIIYYESSYKTINQYTNILEPGFLIGRQWIFNNHFSLDIFTGLKLSLIINSNYQNNNFYYTNFPNLSTHNPKIRGGVTFGYVF
ncbi:MAG: hypothetical protein Kow0079_06810 [Vicingaceae bacterium]